MRRPLNFWKAACASAILVAGTALAAGQDATKPTAYPIAIEHSLGKTVIARLPEQVAALDMNELDFLDQLGVPVAGAAKDFVPHFLEKYKNDPNVADLGFIVKPNVERIYALRPDLILLTPLQAEQYKEMARIAPVLLYDVDYRHGGARHVEIVKDHLLTLGRIFGKEEVARARNAELDARVAEVRNLAQNSDARALIVMHNNGAFSAFSPKSRYGFVFDVFGVKPANPSAETGLHGQPVTSEFIQSTNPDIIFVIDRSSVMERRPVLNAASIENPLIKETSAWKNGKVVFVDPEAWYVTGASTTSLKIMLSDVERGYAK